MKPLAKACAGFTPAATAVFLIWCAGAYTELSMIRPDLAPFGEIWFRVGINALHAAFPAFEAFCYATGLFI